MGRVQSRQTPKFRGWDRRTESRRDLYLGTAKRHFYHLNIDSGEVLSDFATDAAPTGYLTVADGSLLIFLGDEILASFDLDLKKQRWSWKLPKNGPLRGRISGKEMCWLAIVEN